jgi:hypothetical protein
MSNQGSQTKSVKDTQDPLSFQMKGQMRNLGVPFFSPNVPGRKAFAEGDLGHADHVIADV